MMQTNCHHRIRFYKDYEEYDAYYDKCFTSLSDAYSSYEVFFPVAEAINLQGKADVVLRMDICTCDGAT